MPAPHRHAIAVAPGRGGTWIHDAVISAGGAITEPGEASGLVWTRSDRPDALAEMISQCPQLGWVQLPFAGVDPYLALIRANPAILWTCGKGVYAEPVAEHALGLALAGLRNLAAYARARTWEAGAGTNLLGARVVVLGAGGITRSFLRLLEPFHCHVTVVRRRPEPLAGADAVVTMDGLDQALEGADLVVLALALTPGTEGVLDRRRLELLAPHAWVVNVARGAHVVTDDLVAVLAERRIGGAALDVTDPEPLPDGHPLWDEPRCLITPHTANTAEMAVPLLGARVSDNVRRWIAGDDLVGSVDAQAGY